MYLADADCSWENPVCGGGWQGKRCFPKKANETVSPTEIAEDKASGERLTGCRAATATPPPPCIGPGCSGPTGRGGVPLRAPCACVPVAMMGD